MDIYCLLHKSFARLAKQIYRVNFTLFIVIDDKVNRKELIIEAERLINTIYLTRNILSTYVQTFFCFLTTFHRHRHHKNYIA